MRHLLVIALLGALSAVGAWKLGLIGPPQPKDRPGDASGPALVEPPVVRALPFEKTDQVEHLDAGQAAAAEQALLQALQEAQQDSQRHQKRIEAIEGQLAPIEARIARYEAQLEQMPAWESDWQQRWRASERLEGREQHHAQEALRIERFNTEARAREVRTDLRRSVRLAEGLQASLERARAGE